MQPETISVAELRRRLLPGMRLEMIWHKYKLDTSPRRVVRLARSADVVMDRPRGGPKTGPTYLDLRGQTVTLTSDGITLSDWDDGAWVTYRWGWID